MNPIEKAAAYVVGIAEAEIGYCEKASNANLNDKTANPGNGNWTKYGAYFDSIRGEYEYYNGKKNGFDWCDLFVDWCFAQAFGIDDGRKVLYQPMGSCGAGCKYSASYFRANGAWSSVPHVGDQIFFGPKGDESHTGLVVDVSANKVWTVEGNASNRVMRREYALNAGNIAGFGRPDYNLVAYKFAEPVTPDTPIKDDQEDMLTRAAIEKLIDEKLEKAMGPMIERIGDIPWASVRKEMRKLLDAEAIDGGTPYEKDPDDIGLPLNIVRALVASKRYVVTAIREALKNG